MKHHTLLTIAFLNLVAAVFADVKVSIADVSDQRTTGGFFKGLELTLKLQGPELAEAKGMKFTVSEAKDDLGTDISKIEKFGFDSGDFDRMEKPFGRQSKDGDFEHKLKLPNPARAAKTVKLVGELNLLVPSKDPASVITVSPAKEAGKPVDNAALKDGGAEITLTTPKGSEVGYKFNDPKGIVAAVEFCSADGKPLKTTGRMSTSFGGATSISVSLQDKPPADMVAKIFLITVKSVIKVPIKIDAIPLP